MVSSLNACPYPEPALTHLSTHLLVVTATQLHAVTVNFGITANLNGAVMRRQQPVWKQAQVERPYET